MTIDELIAALESAEGPAFVLDRQIGAAVGWPSGLIVPAFTGSVDSALSLIPPGDGPIRLDILQDGSGIVQYVGNGWDMQHPNYRDLISEECLGATPAIAVCIAALRAMAQGGGE